MESKKDRINNSIENIESAIKYYLKDIESKYLLNKITKKDYIKVIKDFKSISEILAKLKLPKSFGIKKLDEIRVINLSIMDLYEEGDYNKIFSSISNINNEICKDLKEADRKRLGELKKTYNSMSKFYQYRLSKAESSPLGRLSYHDNIDNIRFIISNYLNVKYNFKKVKYDVLDISDVYKNRIQEWTKVINANKYDDDTRNSYIGIKNYISMYARAEVVIDNLFKMGELCDEEAYFELKKRIQELILKYQKIYDENKEKYNAEVKKLNVKNGSREEEISELKDLRDRVVSYQEKPITKK